MRWSPFIQGALFGEQFKDGLVKKVEADSAISKAVNIVNRSTNNAVECTRGQPGVTILFTAARPASTELCPAGIQVRTDTSGRGSLPQRKPTSGKATYSSASGRIRQIRQEVWKQSKPTVSAVPAQVAAVKVPPPAGKLLYHLRTWRTITQDPWVLNVI